MVGKTRKLIAVEEIARHSVVTALGEAIRPDYCLLKRLATANDSRRKNNHTAYDLKRSGHVTKTQILLQPLRWRCVECAIHHKRDVREEQHHRYVARTSNNKVIMACDLYCCLLPQCEALRTCRSGFPIATISRAQLSLSQHGQKFESNYNKDEKVWKQTAFKVTATNHKPKFPKYSPRLLKIRIRPDRTCFAWIWLTSSRCCCRR